MTKQGSFGFGGEQRSFSFGCFHADSIPNSLVAVEAACVACEWIQFQNDPDSTGNAYVGSTRLGIVGNGFVLESGDVTGWIPACNLNLFTHKEDDATTMLHYMMIGCLAGLAALSPAAGFLQQENANYLLQEDGSKIIL